MSAGSQIQMAPQSTVNSGQSVHNSQDSNMSTGEYSKKVIYFHEGSDSKYNEKIYILWVVIELSISLSTCCRYSKYFCNYLQAI